MSVKRVALISTAALAACAALLMLRAALAEEPLRCLRDTPDGRTGSWWFPRGGPYLLGFESPGAAELHVDGVRVVASQGAGEHKQRVVYAPGVHAVTFRAPPGARLLWLPPGRRGPLEYVPPSSLSPESPESASFGAGAGAWRTDAAIATALVLVLLGAGLLIARPRVDRQVALACGGVFLLAVTVRLASVGAAGQTWDEDTYWTAGRNYLENLLALDFRESAWRWNYEHPPVTKYIAGLGALWADGYGPARALFALLGAGTCALIVGCGRRLFCLRAGLCAGLTAALLPRLIAHDVVVGHEAPSVFLWTLAVWLSLRVTPEDDAATLVRRLAALGVVIGLAAATRFSNLLVAPLAGVTLLVQTRGRRWLRTVALGTLVAPLAAAATFVAVWPRMWVEPRAHLDAAWRVLRKQHLPEHYLGEVVQLPAWHYFPAYVLATTPLLVLLVAFGLGGWRAVARREAALLILLAWLLVPFGVAWSPVRQDGVRYVLPVLVPLALLCGAGLDQLLGGLRRGRAALVAAGTALAGYLAVTCARIHPYYLDYYNEAVGGPARVAAADWFEVGWWGEGIADAVEYVNRHAAEGDLVYRLVQPTHVNWFRHDLWRDASPTTATWLVVNDAGLAALAALRRPPVTIPADAELVHEVRAQGASLVRVYRRGAVP